eukprot:scaffold125858_cov51-Phaeocystis_antarctica.AAC.2
MRSRATHPPSLRTSHPTRHALPPAHATRGALPMVAYIFLHLLDVLERLDAAPLLHDGRADVVGLHDAEERCEAARPYPALLGLDRVERHQPATVAGGKR